MLVLGVEKARAAAPGPWPDGLGLGQAEPGSVGCRRGALPSAGGGSGERSDQAGPSAPPTASAPHADAAAPAEKHAGSP